MTKEYAKYICTDIKAALKSTTIIPTNASIYVKNPQKVRKIVIKFIIISEETDEDTLLLVPYQNYRTYYATLFIYICLTKNGTQREGIFQVHIK